MYNTNIKGLESPMSVRTSVSEDELNRMIEEVKPLTKGFDVLTDHVVITDINGNIIYANKAAEESTGFSISEMLGKNPGDLWGGHMPNELYRDLWNTVKTLKKSWRGQVNNHKKDGTPYKVWLRVSPILDSSNNCRYFVAIEPRIDTSNLSDDQLQKAIAAKSELYDFYRGKTLTSEDLNKIIDKFIEVIQKDNSGQV